jgi:Recombination endonuclease VII
MTGKPKNIIYVDGKIHKKCSGKRHIKCERVLPLTNEFFRLHPNGAFGYDSSCLECQRSYDKWYSKIPENKERRRLSGLNRSYGVKLEDYNDLMKNPVCRICGKPETQKNRNGDIKRISIDHCHKTGKVRGLLCSEHNILLGMYEKIIGNNLIPVFDNYLNQS